MCQDQRHDPLNYYAEQFKSKDKKRAEFFAYEWAYYELSLCFMQYSPKNIQQALGTVSTLSLAILEAHYMKNYCFLPKNYILKNAQKIAHIPTVIVQGRHDVVCPPIQAYQLAQKLKNVQLSFMNSGHFATLAMKKRLKREVERVYARSSTI